MAALALPGQLNPLVWPFVVLITLRSIRTRQALRDKKLQAEKTAQPLAGVKNDTGGVLNMTPKPDHQESDFLLEEDSRKHARVAIPRIVHEPEMLVGLDQGEIAVLRVAKRRQRGMGKSPRHRAYRFVRARRVFQPCRHIAHF